MIDFFLIFLLNSHRISLIQLGIYVLYILKTRLKFKSNIYVPPLKFIFMSHFYRYRRVCHPRKSMRIKRNLQERVTRLYLPLPNGIQCESQSGGGLRSSKKITFSNFQISAKLRVEISNSETLELLLFRNLKLYERSNLERPSYESQDRK